MFNPTLRRLALAVLLLALLVPPAGRVIAQATPISMNVVAGFDGAYHRGAWFPILVNLSNDGPDVSGLLSWSYPAQPDEGMFQVPVDLPRGARKQVRMSVLARNFVRNGELSLLRDGQVLTSQTVALDGLDQDTFLLGVISSDPALLNSLGALQNPSNGLRVSVRHFDASLLPEQPEGLGSLNALFLHDLDTASLTQAQRRTLGLWVQQGGQLVLSGGLNAERSAAGLDDLLPVDLTGRVLQSDLSPLARSVAVVAASDLSGTPIESSTPTLTATATDTATPAATPSETSTPGPAGTPTDTATPDPTATPSETSTPDPAIPATAPPLSSLPNPPLQLTGSVAEARLRQASEVLAGGEHTLMVRRKIGSGQVIFCAFDLAAVNQSGWRGDLAMWARTIEIRPLANIVSLTHNNTFGGIQEVLRFGANDLPSAGTLMLALLAYILIVGPITYLVLRWLRRIDWAWLTLPLTMLAFAALFYLAGFGLRSGQVPVSQLALVQSAVGRPESVVSAFVRLYSSNRSRYTLGLPADSLAAELFFWFRGGSTTATVLNGPEQVELPDVVVDVGSVRTFTVQTALDTSLRVDGSLVGSGSSAAIGSLRYSGTEPLEDALVVYGNHYQLLGTLAPGEQRSLKLDQAGTPPTDYLPSRIGSIDRQRLVTLLFNGSIAPLGRGDVGYLLAWRIQPTLPILLNGQPAEQEGVTLYIVQLSR